jgi:hypothetical protein
MNWQQARPPLLTPFPQLHWKSHNFSALKTVCSMPSSSTSQPLSPQCDIFRRHREATMRPAPDATAYAHRDARFVMNVHGRWMTWLDDAAGIVKAAEY